VCCSVLQCVSVAVMWSAGQDGAYDNLIRHVCDTLRHTATHCDTLQHTATHCNALQRTATRIHVYIFECVMSHVTSIILTRSRVCAMTQWSVVAVASSVWRVT